MSDAIHGHIVYNGGIIRGLVLLLCSNCGEFIQEKDRIKGVCPHCGALFDDGYYVASVDPFWGLRGEKNE